MLESERTNSQKQAYVAFWMNMFNILELFFEQKCSFLDLRETSTVREKILSDSLVFQKDYNPFGEMLKMRTFRVCSLSIQFHARVRKDFYVWFRAICSYEICSTNED